MLGQCYYCLVMLNLLCRLYFIYCLDVNDNELAYLEIIHLFVELLDKFFTSVCELDLVFNFYKVLLLFAACIRQ